MALLRHGAYFISAVNQSPHYRGSRFSSCLAMNAAPRYDRTGRTCNETRKLDLRIAQHIETAVRAIAFVVNIGSGSGATSPEKPCWTRRGAGNSRPRHRADWSVPLRFPRPAAR